MSDKYRAPFLPDFCRRQWVSDEARKIWEPRIARIGAQFAAAELASVELGIRDAALQNISPDNLPEMAKRAAKKQLVAIPLGNQARPESYSATPEPIKPGQPWDYRVVITRIDRAADFIAAWGTCDDMTGDLLGYPLCCRNYFRETWGAGSFDPTWDMDRKRLTAAWPETNILLRWLGVRYIPHMPCSSECRGSYELGRQMRELIPLPERGWMDDLLSMPMLWSSANSIGEVVTPIVTVNFRSDPAPELREIRREGSFYPEGGASGIRFPYIREPPKMTGPQECIDNGLSMRERVARARAAGVMGHADSIEMRDSREWTDNGFTSLEAMERAHKTIEAVRPPINGGRSVLDLGCGNGLLARRMAGVRGWAEGVEVDPGRAGRAEDNLDVSRCRISEFEFNYLSRTDLVLLMPGRLLGGEATLEQAQATIKGIRSTMGELLVYAYGDTLEKYDTLGELCGPAGIKGELSTLGELCALAGLKGELTELQSDDGVAAGIWRFA